MSKLKSSIELVQSAFAQARESWDKSREDSMQDYRIGKPTRHSKLPSGILQTGSHADYHHRNESQFFAGIEVARDLDRNDIVIGQGINRLVSNVIQGGFLPDPDTGNATLNQMLVDDWWSWSMDAKQCDVQYEHTFPDIERLMFRHNVVDGDVFAFPLRSGGLEMLEAHRVRTPVTAESQTADNIVLGVQLNRDRQRVGYWISKEDIKPHGAPLFRDARFVRTFDAMGTRQVFHFRHSNRISQTRGFTKLAPCGEAAQYHDDIQFATMVQRKFASFIAMFRKIPLEAMGQEWAIDTMETYSTAGTNPHGSSTITGVSLDGPLAMIQGRPGEDFIMDSPNIPNPEFFPHAKLILTFVSINLDLPLCLLLLDAGETNFSGFRGAIQQAQMRFAEFQRRLADSFHAHVWRWRVARLLATNEEAARLALLDGVMPFQHEWQFPKWPYIQPREEAAADELLVRNRLSSRRRVMERRGLDVDKEDRTTIDDNAAAVRMAKEAASKINTTFNDGDPVGWRELWNPTVPQGVQLSLMTHTEDSNGNDNRATE